MVFGADKSFVKTNGFFDAWDREAISAFSELHLTPNVAAGLKRYRLLSDLDSSTLSSIDSMSLDELDYVELA